MENKLKLCNNMEIKNNIQNLFMEYSIAEKHLFMLMNEDNGSNNVEANRMNVVDRIEDVEYTLGLLKNYIYNCSLIDDEY